MAEIHHTTLVPSKLELLTSWLPQQRWYAAKGRTPVLRKLGEPNRAAAAAAARQRGLVPNMGTTPDVRP